VKQHLSMVLVLIVGLIMGCWLSTPTPHAETAFAKEKAGAHEQELVKIFMNPGKDLENEVNNWVREEGVSVTKVAAGGSSILYIFYVKR